MKMIFFELSDFFRLRRDCVHFHRFLFVFGDGRRREKVGVDDRQRVDMFPESVIEIRAHLADIASFCY